MSRFRIFCIVPLAVLAPGRAVKVMPAFAVGASLMVAAAACSSGSSSAAGPAHASPPVSPVSAAAAGIFHANSAPSLSAVKPASQPAWYIVRGPAAPGQIAVLGSEPGESDYSPLWQTVIVRWKPGVTPQVLTSDNMILDLAKKGQLTATKTAVIVNATVVPKS